MSPITTAIEQLNLSYSELEDRLLLKIGMKDQSEIAIWITRRVCKDLWHLLQESNEQMVSALKDKPASSDKTQAKMESLVSEMMGGEPLPAPKLVRKSQPVDSTAEATTLPREYVEKVDFNQTYMANRKPLADTPFLVVSCEVNDAAEKTNLAFKAKTGEVVTMGLTLELIVALSNMMQLATKEASWDLLMLQKNVTRHLAPSSEVIH